MVLHCRLDEFHFLCISVFDFGDIVMHAKYVAIVENLGLESALEGTIAEIGGLRVRRKFLQLLLLEGCFYHRVKQITIVSVQLMGLK